MIVCYLICFSSQWLNQITIYIHVLMILAVSLDCDYLMYLWSCDLGPLYWHGWTLIPACINNHMPNNVCNAIIHPVPNFNGCTIEVWEWVSNCFPHFTIDAITYHLLVKWQFMYEFRLEVSNDSCNKTFVFQAYFNDYTYWYQAAMQFHTLSSFFATLVFSITHTA